jgi:ABC-2 type transport system permease protein
MTALLKIEWMKLRNYRTFWIMSLLFTVLLTVFYVLVGLGLINMGSNGINILAQAQSFTKVWDDLCFYASWFVIALAILMAIITTNEYQYRTNRQNIIDGWNRVQFYHSKWVILIAISFGTTVFVFLLGLLAGVLSGISLSTCFENSQKLIWMFLLTVNYLGFAMTLSFFFKRSGITIGIFMFYSMIAEFIMHGLFVFKFKNLAGDFFLPLQTSDELLPLGISKFMQMGLKTDFYPQPWHYAVATLAWISLYYCIGRIRLAKSDW